MDGGLIVVEKAHAVVYRDIVTGYEGSRLNEIGYGAHYQVDARNACGRSLRSYEPVPLYDYKKYWVVER